MKNKGLIIIIVGLVLFAGGLFNMQTPFFWFVACFCAGSLIGVGIAITLNEFKNKL